MWIFDDGDYPSGKANGLLVKKYPELTKRYMAVQSIDALGPAKSRSVLIDAWLRPEEELLCVLAGKRIDHKDRFDGDTLIDLSDYVKNGILYWDIPEGEWRIFVIKITKNGGEEWTKDYLNPCDPEGTRAYLDLIYEEHYRHFKDEFGKTIKGFFTDEPRFGNCQGYDKNIGSDMVLPWSKTLLAELSDYGMGCTLCIHGYGFQKISEVFCRTARRLVQSPSGPADRPCGGGERRPRKAWLWLRPLFPFHGWNGHSRNRRGQ